VPTLFLIVMTSIILIILLIAIHVANYFLRPKIDKTRDGDIILWYGRDIRRYVILVKK
jgi:hypothetical protein